VARVEGLGEGSAEDGVYLAGSASKIVFRHLGRQHHTDLVLSTERLDTPQLLTLPINTPASEWGARVGPNNELLFVRGDRQLALFEGTLRQVRIPTPHRAVVTEVAPATVGEWVFLCRPSYQPVEIDQDIWVARWVGSGRLGEPVPVDDWHPWPDYSGYLLRRRCTALSSAFSPQGARRTGFRAPRVEIPLRKHLAALATITANGRG
jgi:hypothetical protein